MMGGDSQRGKGPPGSLGSSDNASEVDGGGEQNRLRMLAMRRRMQQQRDGGETESGGKQDASQRGALPAEVRGPLERSFGQDFGDVQIQPNSARAGGSTYAVTEGNAIHFAPGQYQPDQPQGKQLLAHELAHVVQQRGTGEKRAQAFEEGQERGLLEQDADRAAAAAVAGQRATVQLGAAHGMPQHFDSWEHQHLGNAGGGDRKIKLKCDLVLDWGDVTFLMGDFYSTPEALMNADRDEVLSLLSAVKGESEQAEKNGGKPTDKESAQNEEKFERATAWRKEPDRVKGKKTGKTKGERRGTDGLSYLDLADKNGDHFSPANRERYVSMHEKALMLADQAHNETDEAKREALLNEANLNDAAACHFLTDAFSSGHAVSGETGRRVGKAFWEKNQAAIIATVTNAAKGDKKLGGLGAKIDVAVVGLVHLLKAHAGSLSLKLVHDKLNQDGLDVINARGDKWKTYGDTNLSMAPQTQQFGAEAVTCSRKEIESAANHGQKASTRMSALDLIPQKVGFCGAFMPLEEFVSREDIFDEYLRPLILVPSPDNPLYKLIKGNLGIMLVEGEEEYSKIENADSAVLDRAKADAEETGLGTSARSGDDDVMVRRGR